MLEAAVLYAAGSCSSGEGWATFVAEKNCAGAWNSHSATGPFDEVRQESWESFQQFENNWTIEVKHVKTRKNP